VKSFLITLTHVIISEQFLSNPQSMTLAVKWHRVQYLC